jgi:hypothetical protein
MLGPLLWAGCGVDAVQRFFIAIAVLGAVGFVATFDWMMLFG